MGKLNFRGYRQQVLDELSGDIREKTLKAFEEAFQDGYREGFNLGIDSDAGPIPISSEEDVNSHKFIIDTK